MDSYSSAVDIDKLMELCMDAVKQRLEALELENEALKMRLNEARVKLELARERLQSAGLDAEGIDLGNEPG